jgi:hypothetical protein
MKTANYDYQSIADVEEAPLKIIDAAPTITSSEKAKRITLSLVVFLVTFLFYGYCIYKALAPLVDFIDQEDEMLSHRRLEGAAANNCTPAGASKYAAAGTVAGAALMTLGFVAIGLTPFGPIAGGLFAANMGAGLAAGTFNIFL